MEVRTNQSAKKKMTALMIMIMTMTPNMDQVQLVPAPGQQAAQDRI